MDQTDEKKLSSERLCSNCSVPLILKLEEVPLDQHLPHLFSYGLYANIYVCPQCGKLEFYQFDSAEDRRQKAAKQEAQMTVCPRCSTQHHATIGCPSCAVQRSTSYRAPVRKDRRKKDSRPPWER